MKLVCRSIRDSSLVEGNQNPTSFTINSDLELDKSFFSNNENFESLIENKTISYSTPSYIII